MPPWTYIPTHPTQNGRTSHDYRKTYTSVTREAVCHFNYTERTQPITTKLRSNAFSSTIKQGTVKPEPEESNETISISGTSTAN